MFAACNPQPQPDYGAPYHIIFVISFFVVFFFLFTGFCLKGSEITVFEPSETFNWTFVSILLEVAVRDFHLKHCQIVCDLPN